MTNKQITIEVDGKSLKANKGQMLIEVTDANDVSIPRFCYHKKLSIAANCRMCLVEVDKVPKPLPACATPVMDGMKVKTNSNFARDAQKSVMEFLLINHPLDCPICDQGGECELQDLAMGYGRDVSRYQENKRVVKDPNIGHLIQTDLTRCIHCTRCVRFGEEIAGLRELGATGRGENMQIGTYISKSLVSEMSGNIIDLCPVGALTSKPYRYSARTWELVQKTGIAPHDSVGSNIYFHVKGDQVKRVVPASNESINEVWLSDRDRFSYEGMYSADRLQMPMVKEDGVWKTVHWEVAFNLVKTCLQKIIKAHGPARIGAIASPSSTLEALYIFQKMIRALGSNNIDSRLRQIDFSDQDKAPLFPFLGLPIAEFEKLDGALLIGSNVRKEQPIINHRLRKAALNGGAIMLLNTIDYEFNYDVAAREIVSPAQLPLSLAGVVKALLKLSNVKIDQSLKSALKAVPVSDVHQQIADHLMRRDKTIVLLGNSATSHPQFSLLRTLAGLIAKLSQANFGYLTESSNCAGAWLTGAVPHRLAGGQDVTSGMNIQQMLDANLSTYILMDVEPELDFWDSQQATKAMQNAGLVISLSAYRSEAMAAYANFMLPISVFAETDGTYINNEGTHQHFAAAVPPLAEVKPAWKILRVLANHLELDEFEYQSTADIYAEWMQKLGKINNNNLDQWQDRIVLDPNTTLNNTLQRITEVPMNCIDPILRRATALQKTDDIADGAIRINTTLATKSNLTDNDEAEVTQDDNSAILKVIIDDRVPDNCVLIKATHPAQVPLGGAFGAIVICKI